MSQPGSYQQPVAHEVDHKTAHPVRKTTLWVSKAISLVVYVYILFVEVILFLGFLLLLLGANPTSSFVEWVYRSMDRAMRPFRGIFEPIEIGVTQSDVPSVFETSVVFAMIVYGVVALVVSALLEWLNSRLAKLDREDQELQRRQFVTQTMASQGGTGEYPPVVSPDPIAPMTPDPTNPPQPPPGGSPPAG